MIFVRSTWGLLSPSPPTLSFALYLSFWFHIARPVITKFHFARRYQYFDAAIAHRQVSYHLIDFDSAFISYERLLAPRSLFYHNAPATFNFTGSDFRYISRRDSWALLGQARRMILWFRLPRYTQLVKRSYFSAHTACLPRAATARLPSAADARPWPSGLLIDCATSHFATARLYHFAFWVWCAIDAYAFISLISRALTLLSSMYRRFR